jgi:transposase-like protein
MRRARKQYSAEMKAKIAVEAIKGQRTIQEIASHYEVHPSQVTQWKKQLLAESTAVFSRARSQQEQAEAELKSELYEQIGKLQVELDWLKKKSGISR